MLRITIVITKLSIKYHNLWYFIVILLFATTNFLLRSIWHSKLDENQLKGHNKLEKISQRTQTKIFNNIFLINYILILTTGGWK